jgi:dipeptidyl-peptidase III
LLDGEGCLNVIRDEEQQNLTVKVDRERIIPHGKNALGKMLLRLHMYRCTADVDGCRVYYEGLSAVDGIYLEWREAVLAQKPPPLVFVQANTFLDGERVILKEYEPTFKGIIQSWAERVV